MVIIIIIIIIGIAAAVVVVVVLKIPTHGENSYTYLNMSYTCLMTVGASTTLKT